jgi:hypothetical protein
MCETDSTLRGVAIGTCWWFLFWQMNSAYLLLASSKMELALCFSLGKCPKRRSSYFSINVSFYDRLCGLMVSVPGYRSRGPRFDSRLYQIF